MTPTPKWLQKAVFYEIYPQSFFDTNGDGIGDLGGVEEKLDYIVSMGFNAIWLNPIFESMFFDAGYDVSDYKKVASRYGGNSALTSLIKACHEKGIHLLLDLVPGHTCINHEWFKQSSKPEENEYTDRFIWNKDIWNVDPKFNWIRGFYDHNGAAMVNFFSIQPKLNYGFARIEHPEYEEPIDGEGPRKTLEAMEDVVRFYLKQGIDGFRVDMAGWLVARDDDNTATPKVWKRFFEAIKPEFPESAFVSEWAVPAHSLPAGFDMDFMLQDLHYNSYGLLCRAERGKHPFFEKEGDNETAVKYFEIVNPQVEEALKQGRYLAMISGNHDTTRLSEWLDAKEASLLYLFMASFPNVPFFYYGDEILMHYLKGISSVEGGYNRTGSRSPMQWDTSLPSAGFSSSAKTYIRLDEDRAGLSVEEQEKDPESLLCNLRKILLFKAKHAALDNDASYRMLENGKNGVLIYEREKGGEKLRVYLNPRGEGKAFSASGEILFALGEASLENGSLSLGEQSACVVKLA